LASKYSNKLAFITGGSEGIGRSIAEELLKLGCRVSIFSRSEKKLELAAHELSSKQPKEKRNLKTRSLDVTDYDQVEKVFEEEIAFQGIPDFLINCAGLAKPGYLHELPVADDRLMMELNYFGILHTCKVLAPHFMKKKSGFIVNTSSMAGFMGLFGYTGYCASKYAVVGFSEALRRELEPFSVYVSVLCPPNTRTPGLIEENRTKPPEVLATEEKAKVVDPEFVARYLLKNLDKDKFILVPTFDGGMAYWLSRFSPKLLNQFVKRPHPNEKPN
jgi:3-dehydrosphinganine reductase